MYCISRFILIRPLVYSFLKHPPPPPLSPVRVRLSQKHKLNITRKGIRDSVYFLLHLQICHGEAKMIISTSAQIRILFLHSLHVYTVSARSTHTVRHGPHRRPTGIEGYITNSIVLNIYIILQ